MGRYGGGGSLGVVIIGCVVYGVQLGWGRGYGLVCSATSGFFSGCCSQWGFLASGFHCVCVCACACAWLGAFGVSTGEKK